MYASVCDCATAEGGVHLVHAHPFSFYWPVIDAWYSVVGFQELHGRGCVCVAERGGGGGGGGVGGVRVRVCLNTSPRSQHEYSR